MRRHFWLLSLIAVLLLAGSASAKQGTRKIDGTITSVQSNAITVRTDQGGDVYVLIQSGTDFKGNDRSRGLRVGDRVRVEAFVLDDGRVVASSVQVRGRGNVAAYPGNPYGRDPYYPGNTPQQGTVYVPGGTYAPGAWIPGTAAPGPGGTYTPGGTYVPGGTYYPGGNYNPYGAEFTIEGAVTQRTSSTITVLGSDGVTRVVTLTPQTQVTNQRNGIADIVLYDVVRVYGNGNIARSIEVRHRAGAQVFGRIATLLPSDNAVILDNGAYVRINSDGLVLWQGRRMRRMSFQDLRVGQVIRVFGEAPRWGSRRFEATVISVEN